MLRDLDLLGTGLAVLQEAAVSGCVTVVIVDERGAVSGDLPSLLERMAAALGRVDGELRGR